MARARNIKPKFFQNDELGELSPLARLLFIGMWTIADFKGCLEYRVKRMKTQILPYDDCNIEELVSALDKSGFIAIYSVLGRTYIKIIKFEEHQNPHKNEKDAGSDTPDISEKDNGINQLKQDGKNRDKDGCNLAESLFPLPDPLLPILSPAEVLAEQFEIVWKAYPKRSGASKSDALKAWKARVKEGAAPHEILAGVGRYAEYVTAKGTEEQFIKQAATFFGPGKYYAADWAIRPGAAAPAGRASKSTAAMGSNAGDFGDPFASGGRQ